MFSLNPVPIPRQSPRVQPTTPRPSLPRLRLRVTAAAETIVRGGHPWLFGDSIKEQNRPGESGEIGVVYDRKDRFLALGLFDPDSPIRLRLLHVGSPATIDDAWWNQRLAQALDRRRGLFSDQTTGFRWIHGESDGWPAVVLDQYEDTLVLKLYSAVWLPRLRELVDRILAALHPTRLILRLSRNIQDRAKTAGWIDGTTVHGAPPESPVVFRENGILFEADVVRGQKTGFFLDQRENRAWVEGQAKGRRVLNAFSFSGGFSLYAARGEAVSVTDLDISAHALDSADRNFALNHACTPIRQCQRHRVQTDAFRWLAESIKGSFDLVILDPPSLARREHERAGAIQAYQRLAKSGWRQLSPRGVLLAASCSAHVSTDEFFQAVTRGVAESGGKAREIHRAQHPADHAATFPEAQYLKCIALRRE